MMSEHCNECTGAKSCKHHHVYVIELKRSALKEPGFPFKGDLEEGKSVYYVGQTTHRVECRYKQHAKRKSAKKFRCSCFPPEQLRDYKPSNSPGKYVNEHHRKMGLRPELYATKNPVVRKDSMKGSGSAKALKKLAEGKEKARALELRLDGHAVHYN